MNLKRFIKGSDCQFVCVATFPKHSAYERQQILWGCLVNQGATGAWLLAHTTMYCSEGGDHIANPSAQRFMPNRGRKLPLMTAQSWSSTRLWHSHTRVGRRRKASKTILGTLYLYVKVISPNPSSLFTLATVTYREQW